MLSGCESTVAHVVNSDYCPNLTKLSRATTAITDLWPRSVHCVGRTLLFRGAGEVMKLRNAN